MEGTDKMTIIITLKLFGRVFCLFVLFVEDIERRQESGERMLWDELEM